MTLAKNFRITKQRQIILDTLCSVTSHPTADDLYYMVRKRLPKISLGTVYRNLELMSEYGLIQKMEVGGSKKRFDGNAETHYHVRCACCDRVDDLDIPPDDRVDKEASKRTGFTILRHRLEFTGICPDCSSVPTKTASK